MNDAFKTHNVSHLSASTINLWISNPAMCLMKIAGFSSEVGPAAWRGIGVDRAVTALVQNKNMKMETALEIADIEYEDKRRSAISDFSEQKIEKEHTHMRRCVQAAYVGIVESYRGFDFESSQGKVSVDIDDISVPFIGYFDLLFSDKVVDLKSKGQAISTPPLSDCRQLSIYQKATGKTPWVVYITHKEVRQFMIEDCERHLAEIRSAALSLEKILSVSDDIEECCRFLYPDLDHWMWSEQDKVEARRIWRMK